MNKASLLPKVLYILGLLIFIHFVSSAKEAPTKPFAQNTSIAACNAVCSSNLRLRPLTTMISIYCSLLSVLYSMVYLRSIAQMTRLLLTGKKSLLAVNA